MSPELEAILASYHAWKEGRESGATAEELFALYDARLQDALARWPNVSKERLHQIIQRRYRAWLRAQDKPTALPPKA